MKKKDIATCVLTISAIVIAILSLTFAITKNKSKTEMTDMINIGHAHGATDDKIINEKSNELSHVANLDIKRDDLKPGDIVIFYRYGCKDCEGIYNELVDMTDNVESNIYWVASRTENGKELVKQFNIVTVPSAVVIIQNEDWNKNAYVRYVLYEEQKTNETVLNEINIDDGDEDMLKQKVDDIAKNTDESSVENKPGSIKVVFLRDNFKRLLELSEKALNAQSENSGAMDADDVSDSNIDNIVPGKITNPDGSVTETTIEVHDDGSKTITETTTKPDGAIETSVTNSGKTTNEDELAKVEYIDDQYYIGAFGVESKLDNIVTYANMVSVKDYKPHEQKTEHPIVEEEEGESVHPANLDITVDDLKPGDILVIYRDSCEACRNLAKKEEEVINNSGIKNRVIYIHSRSKNGKEIVKYFDLKSIPSFIVLTENFTVKDK